MIDNFDLIAPLFYFSEANNMFFHLQILRRGKDHPDMPAANQLIRTWLVRSVEHFYQIREQVIAMCEYFKARAYINVAGKELYQLNNLIIKKLASYNYEGVVVNPMRVVDSACGELTSKRKCWIVDIDRSDPDYKFEVLSEIDDIWLKTHPEAKNDIKNGDREIVYLLGEIPTLNSYHLLTAPFNLQKFKERFPDIDVHKNNPTVLYIPDCIANHNMRK